MLKQIKVMTLLLTLICSVFLLTNKSVSAKVLKPGPWEMTTDTDQPLVQSVSNGNEIYYSVADNDRNSAIVQKAVANWNNLGVIKLIQVPVNDSRSQIYVKSFDSLPKGMSKLVLANTSYDRLTVLDNSVPAGSQALMDTDISMYPSFDKLSSVKKISCLTHEFGHALGFAHDNRIFNNTESRLTMFHSTLFKSYPLGGLEQSMLASHYHLPITVAKLNPAY